MVIKVKYKRWETVISNCKGLNFKRLVDQGYLLLFEVDDEHNNLYEVVLKCDFEYAYLLRSEGFEGHDVDLRNTGWTYIVEGAPFAEVTDWAKDLKRDYQRGGAYIHYVIATYDSCLEIISNTPPIVRKVN